MNYGDYYEAAKKFKRVSNNYNFSSQVRREAAYYVGFCYVKDRDPWAAVSAYENFLDYYDNGNRRFVPDAMYVLGRTYEELYENTKAKKMYRRCIDRFPGSEFASKSRDRLRKLGGYTDYNSGNGYGNEYNSGISYEVKDQIEWAKDMSNGYERDRMLLKTAKKARNGADFIAISKAMWNDYTRGELFEYVTGSRVFKIMTIYDIVDLAKTTSNSYESDELLLTAAKKVAYSARDFRMLADASSNYYTQSQIKEIGNDKIYGYRLSSRNDGEIKIEKKATKKVAKKSANDPYEGLKADNGKIKRISKFIKAVEAKKDMDKALKDLKKEDLSIDTVKNYMKKYRDHEKFNKLHNK